MASVSHHSGEGGPGRRPLPSPCQPVLQDGIVDALGVATMLLLQGSHSGSTGVLKEEGAKHDVAGAELSDDADGSVCGREADKER